GYLKDVVRFLARCYDKQGAFLDVGANVGLISLPFAATIDPSNMATSPFVYCIEAIRSNYLTLVHNIQINGRQGTIIPIGKGVGECKRLLKSKWKATSRTVRELAPPTYWQKIPTIRARESPCTPRRKT